VSDVGRLERAAAWLGKVQCYSPSFDNVKSLVAFVEQETNSSALAWSLRQQIEQRNAELTRTQAQLVEQDQEHNKLAAWADAELKGKDLEIEALKAERQNNPVRPLSQEGQAQAALLAFVTKKYGMPDWAKGGGWQDGADSDIPTDLLYVLDDLFPEGPTA
jgi:ferric-dicitrate binding protein FerR (iron transport regulator)